MAYTLKELAQTAQLVSQTALERAFTALKNYVDTKDTATQTAIQTQLDTLIGTGGDADKIINTFNEIKAFLADYTKDDTLKSLIDAVNTAVANEQTRATTAEGALSDRITTLENVHVMTAAEAQEIFDEVFNPS